MTGTPVMTAFICDDVRREEGNKVSYMGVYGDAILVGQFPSTLAKLCCVMSVFTPANIEPPQSLAFKLMMDEEPVGELTIDATELLRTESANGADERRRVYNAILGLYPFQLKGPGTLRARSYWDGVELKGGSWRVALA
jgi:hypothetical protein